MLKLNPNYDIINAVSFPYCGLSSGLVTLWLINKINGDHLKISIICPQKSTIFAMFYNKTLHEDGLNKDFAANPS